jgi:cellulose synthase/poly-beta-1,6-N-acetylglucosamine synthase-like glycosyltransferase
MALERSSLMRSALDPVSPWGLRSKVHVSFVIPLFNKEKTISSCLSAVLGNNNEYFESEIIVIDDGSRDGSDRAVRELGNDARLNLIKSEHMGAAHARNVGIARSKGDWLIFLDADSVIEKGFLEAVYSHLVDPNIFIGGWVGALNNGRLLPRLIERWQICRRTTPWGSCVVYPRKILQSIGLFDERMIAGEDGDLCLRALEHGYRCVMLPQIVARTFHPENLVSFLKQKVKDARGFELLTEKHGSEFPNFWKTDMMFKLILIATAAASIALFPFFPLMVIGILPILLYNALRNRDLIGTQGYWFLFPFIFSIADFGFLAGWLLQKTMSLLGRSPFGDSYIRPSSEP